MYTSLKGDMYCDSVRAVVFLFATTNCCEKWHRGLRVTVNVLLVDSLLHQGRLDCLPVCRADAIRVHLTARYESHSISFFCPVSLCLCWAALIVVPIFLAH